MPTLARLTLHHDPASQAIITRAFGHDLSRVLAQHSLADPSPCPRPAVPGLSSCLYAVERPAQVHAVRHALATDPRWHQQLAHLATLCMQGAPGATPVDEPTASVMSPTDPAPAPPASSSSVPSPPEPLRWTLTLYSTEIGPGVRVTAGPGIRNGLWHTLTLQDGLHSAVVNYLFQDRQGHLWIATGDGLSRYDGIEFWHLTGADGLPHDDMMAVAQTPDNMLWFASNGQFPFSACGLCRFDGRSLVHYTAVDGLPSDSVFNLWVDAQGRLWAFTLAGPAVLAGDRFEPIPGLAGVRLPPIIRAWQEPDGPLWLVTFDGLWFLANGQCTRLAAADGGLDGMVWSVIGDHRGAIWAGGLQGACRRLPGECFERLAISTPLETHFAAPILEDRDHGIWFGAYPRGVFRYQNGEAAAFATHQGLPATRVSCGLLDRDGRVWFSFDGGGLARYAGDRLTYITPEQRLPDNACTFLKADSQGRYWLGTAKGTALWDGRTWQTILPTPNWHTALIDWLETPAGDYWGVAHNGQVLHCPAGEESWVESLPSPRLGHNNGSLAWAPETAAAIAGLWCANGAEGVHRYHTGAWQTYTPADGVPPGQVRAVAVDAASQRVYLGTTLGGVSFWDGTSYTPVDSGESWGRRPILHLYVDRHQRLWIGTEGRGVFCWDGQSCRGYTRDHGLAANRVLRTTETREGHLVFCTQGGGASLFDGQVFQTFDQRAGLANEVVKDFLEDQQGRYWFATQDGITRYQPGTGRPTLRLGEIFADRVIAPATSGPAFPGPVAVPVSQRVIRLGFCPADLGGDRLAYRYRLVGHDDDWTQSRDAEALYTDLAVGDYTFEVQAVDLDLHYSDLCILQLEIVPDPRDEALNAALRLRESTGGLVGSSEVMTELRQSLEELAAQEVTVLLLGESGTGKALAAEFLHGHSPRRSGKFVYVNCGAIPAELIDSQLFGHEKGSFTGAQARHLGYVELAAGGTLFLDEIGEMSLDAQVRLLHLLDGRPYHRVGGSEPLTLQARVVAATNRNLQARIQENAFRADLYHRLNQFPVLLPPLSERLEDLPELVDCFLAQYNRKCHKEVKGISLEAMDALRTATWTGNVRDLEHAIYRAVLHCRGLIIEVDDLFALPGQTSDGTSLSAASTKPSAEIPTLAENERRCLLAALEATDWVIEGPAGAAARLQVKPSTLRDRMARHSVKRKGHI